MVAFLLNICRLSSHNKLLLLTTGIFTLKMSIEERGCLIKWWLKVISWQVQKTINTQFAGPQAAIQQKP